MSHISFVAVAAVHLALNRLFLNFNISLFLFLGYVGDIFTWHQMLSAFDVMSIMSMTLLQNVITIKNLINAVINAEVGRHDIRHSSFNV